MAGELVDWLSCLMDEVVGLTLARSLTEIATVL